MSEPSPRYPGSPPFGDSPLERLLFRGRADEAEQLTADILSDDLVVVFGVSGTGKTSLLQAGVFHRLREADLWPVVIRLNDPSRSPTELVADHIAVQAEHDALERLPAEPESHDLWELLAGLEVWDGDILLTPVLVFDQFEELFTLDWDAVVREDFLTRFGWVARGFRPLEEGGVEGRPPAVKTVILIREDSLGELEALAGHVPNVLHNRFRLVALDLAQAEEAIRGPARLVDERLASPPFEYEGDALALMLDFLCTREARDGPVKTDSVDPSQLQIICQYVEDVLVRQAGHHSVSADDLGGRTGLNRVLQDFYRRALAAIPDDYEAAARRLCETGLINASGRRLSLEVGEIERGFGVPEPELERLVAQRLLRAEARTGSRYYELAHDSLVRPILDDRAARLREKASVRRKRVAVGLAAALAIGLVALLAGVYQLASDEVPGMEGTVVDSTGQPAAGVIVQFFAPGRDGGCAGVALDKPVAVAVTEGDAAEGDEATPGRFEATLGEGSYCVRFVAEGRYQERWWDESADAASALSQDDARPVALDGPRDLGDIELPGRKGSIAGNLAAAGETVTVTLIRADSGEELGREEVEESFAFDGLDTPGRYELRFGAVGLGDVDLRVDLQAGEDREVRDVVLTTAQEEALQDEIVVSFAVRIDERSASDPDDPDVPRLATGEAFTVSILVTNNGGAPIEGTVVDVIDGNTLLDVTVRPGETRTLTNDLNAVDLSAQSGPDIVEGCGNDRPTRRYRAELRVADLLEEAQAHYCNPDDPVVSGTALVDGEPLAGVEIDLVDVDEQEVIVATVETGDDGRYRFTPGPGSYELRVDPPGGTRVESTPDPARLQGLGEGDRVSMMTDIVLEAVVVSGEVTVNGVAVPDVDVTLTGSGGTRHTVTNGEGEFAFDQIDDGSYTVGVLEVIDQQAVTVRNRMDVTGLTLSADDLPAVSALPSFLSCRDLEAVGYTALDAFDYWLLEDFPGRLDPDGDFVPCETVFVEWIVVVGTDDSLEAALGEADRAAGSAYEPRTEIFRQGDDYHAVVRGFRSQVEAEEEIQDLAALFPFAGTPVVTELATWCPTWTRSDGFDDCTG